MIGFLKGKVIEVSSDAAIVLNQGVGYEVTASLNTLSEIQGAGGEVSLWIHTHVREDQLQLFGFLSAEEKQVFLQLLKVNGIGPKSAINILSGASFDQLMQMIETEDVKALSHLPKVGKKTAEQMILTLKGKLVRSDSAAGAPVKVKPHRELFSALVNLGFRSQDVEKVVSDLSPQTDLESGLKTALAALTHL